MKLSVSFIFSYSFSVSLFMQGTDSWLEYKVIRHEPQYIVVEADSGLQEGNGGVGSSPEADAACVSDGTRDRGQ